MATAKKREVERLTEIQERFLAIVQKEFDRGIFGHERESDDYLFILDKNKFIGVKKNDIIKVGHNLGFEVHYWAIGEYSITVPQRLKGQKPTIAQRMLYWSNLEINRRIKSEKENAQKASKEIWEKIKQGDFVSEKYGNEAYRITVKSDDTPPKPSEIFENEVKRIFEKKKFEFLYFSGEDGAWNFKITDNRITD